MAFAIPIVAAFGAAGAAGVTIGAALSGAAGFATFASVAGGFLAGAGMLTKNKTLTKIGSVLGLAGAVTGIASSLSSGASSAASGAASSAGEAAGEAAATSGADSLANQFASSPLGQGAGQAASDASQQIGTQIGAQVGGDASQLGNQTLGSFGQAPAATSGAGSALTLDPNGLGGSPNLMDQYRMATDQSQLGSFADGMTGTGASGATSKLTEAGAQIKDRTALETILDKVSGVGKWIKDNPGVAQVAGQAVAGGMQAYQQGQQLDAQMNLLAQRRARLNQPVSLGIQPIQLKTPGG